MPQFDPPDSHWAADFDQRLTSTFHWLRDRIVADEGGFAAALREIRELKAEMEQLVADAHFLAKTSTKQEEK